MFKKRLALLLALVVVMSLGTAAGASINYPTYSFADWQSGDAESQCAAVTALTGIDYFYAWKLEGAAPNGSWTHFGNTITISGSNGKVFNWSSTQGIGAVVVKGGPGANIWVYDPQAYGDTGLYSPNNPGGNLPDVSHVTFCWNPQLEISKTAVPSYTRTYQWSILKWADHGDGVTTDPFDEVPPRLILAPGESHLVHYSVLVDVAGHSDGDWAVSGAITIHNPAPDPATLIAVSDEISGGFAASVDCGATVSGYVLSGGGTLVCTYEAGLSDAAARTNTATVTVETPFLGDTTSVPFEFGAPTSLVDECVAVSDTDMGSLGTVCVDTAPRTFTYSLEYGNGGFVPWGQCGYNEHANTASFVTNDTGTTGSADWLVSGSLACEPQGGCTLTQGYWKTHSSYGPARYDDAWALLSGGANTSFFLSGQSYYQVMWTPPAGNAYYILAHQYIGARLNILNGADPTAVQAAMSSAETLFGTYTPAQIAALKGKYAAPIRAQFISLSEILDAYNSGYIGPGHCSE
jgi:hypothetical protein